MTDNRLTLTGNDPLLVAMGLVLDSIGLPPVNVGKLISIDNPKKVVACGVGCPTYRAIHRPGASQTTKNTNQVTKKVKQQSKAIQAINARLAKSGLEIKNVIFAGERTIVFFEDGTKTTVQCRGGDTYSKEAGIAFAIVKKLLGKYDAGFTEIRGNGYDRLLTDIADEAIKQESVRKEVSEKTKALKGKAKENASEPTPPPKVAPETNGVSDATKAFANS